jgi:hypothetical protein
MSELKRYRSAYPGSMFKQEYDLDTDSSAYVLASEAETALKAKDEEIERLRVQLTTLQAATSVLLEKCDEADADGDMPENIDGAVLDLVRSTLSALDSKEKKE